MIEKLKKMKRAIMIPYGLDKDWDDQCDSSFLRFLDVLYYFLVSIFCCYGALSGFMIVKKMIN